MQANENSTPAEILDSCLSQFQDGEETAEVTLRAFPQHAQDVAPLVKLARQIRVDFPVPAPNENFKRNSKIRLLNRLRATQPPTSAAKPRETKKKRFAWLPARAFLTTFIVLMLAISTTGVAWASSDALPGDALYSVKRGVEELRLGITLSESGDAELLNTFTGERMDEIEALVLAGRDENLTEALQNYEDMLDRLVNQVLEISQNADQASLDKFESNLARQVEVLERVQANMPDSVQAKIEEVKDQTQHGKAVVEYIQQGGNPSDLAPGQLKKETPQSDTGSEGHGSGKTKTPKPKEKKTPGPPPWANPGGQDNPDIE
jgi:hypothetical protein